MKFSRCSNYNILRKLNYNSIYKTIINTIKNNISRKKTNS